MFEKMSKYNKNIMRKIVWRKNSLKSKSIMKELFIIKLEINWKV